MKYGIVISLLLSAVASVAEPRAFTSVAVLRVDEKIRRVLDEAGGS